MTDADIQSIVLIQQAHKKADNNFNDIVAQLYQQEFKTQEKAKYEHIKQAKEKALEEQRIEYNRILEDEKARAEQSERENKERAEQETLEARGNDNGLDDKEPPTKPDEAVTTTENSTSSVIESDWSQVSPEQASEYMSARTGVPASTWQAIIYAESTNNPTVTNSIGCFGYLQLHPVHGNVSSMTPQQYLDTAVSVYNSQGLSAWQVTTNGMVN